MKTAKRYFGVLIIFAVACISFMSAYAAEQQVTKWNEEAISNILKRSELARLEAAFPSWKIKQITWPSEKEINAKRVAVDPNLIIKCQEWLTKFMKREKLPVNMDKKLVAMKEWGFIRKTSEQKRLCDVFIARFTKAPYVFHIQESNSNIVIAIADERLVKEARADHENLIIETAKSILNKELKPNLNPGDFHISETVRQEHKITKITWWLESVIVGRNENGALRISGIKAAEIGTTRVKAETDGRFVKFEIRKRTGGPRRPYPYVERFK